MLVKEADNEIHFNICLGFLAVVAGGTGADDGVSRYLGYWATSVLPQSRPQSSDFLLETGILGCCSPSPITLAYGVLYLVNSSCLPLTRLTPEEQSMKPKT